MIKPRSLILSGIGLLAFSGIGIVAVHAADDPVSTIADPICTFFGADHDKFVRASLKAVGRSPNFHPMSDLTLGVRKTMDAYIPPGTPTSTFGANHTADSIDSYIYADFQANSITPAPLTTDWEFVRRVTLDLTGRIPTPTAVLNFVNDQTPDKRAKYIDTLLASSAWVDKWTMFYGDLFQNTDNRPSTGLRRFPGGRNAFYQYIHDSLLNAKPYNQMASELISTQDTDSYTDGAINYLIGAVVTNGAPAQDTYDAMTAQVADEFLGMTHVNCVLCHNGRGHLDTVSLWGSNVTRYQAWQLSGYMSHTATARVNYDSTNNNVYYWSLLPNPKATDYAMNTTTGNRPARVAPAGCKSGQPCYYVPPQYIFNSDAPHSGEDYRAAFARSVTNDFQFARAAVNYVWAEMFGMGIVDPPDTFDPARLDPNNPPPSPWTLQPTNARLLNALATHFIASKYDVRALMREIANSQTYQLSSRYSGTWNVTYENYFARKFVRRLWSEEVLDAINQSSGVITNFATNGFTDNSTTPNYAVPQYAMQLPDTITVPNDGNTRNFLDAFLRGNRDDQQRKQDGSILQALNLMNNPLMEQKWASTGAAASPLLTQNVGKDNATLINTFYLTILSRYPSPSEMTTATGILTAATTSTARTQAVQDMMWALYNKVDFVFNY